MRLLSNLSLYCSWKMLQVCSYLHLLSVWRSGTSLDFSGFWGKTLSPYLPMVIHIPRRIKSVVIYVVNLVHFSSFAQSCPTGCKPRDCSMPGLPVHHQLPGLAQTHVHQVSEAIQPSYPLSCLSPPVFNLSQHQGLFQWASSSHQVAKVLEFRLQHQSFQWIFRTDFL